MCSCQVTEGGGTILPTETGFFTRKEQQQQWRLGCQVKIREDMKIQIPEEVMGIKKWECEVVSNYNVASFIKEFVFRLPEGETLDFKPGGYIQIDVPEIAVDFKNMDITADTTSTTATTSYRNDSTHPTRVASTREPYRSSSTGR